MKLYKPVNRKDLQLSGIRRIADDQGRHAALHFQADLTVKVIELADTPLGNQMPVAADHTTLFRNDGLLIDRTEFFKFQTGCL